MIVYKTTDLSNGMIYVGQHHTSANDGYLGSGTMLKQKILEIGIENFEREILEHCNSKKELYERELYWINELSATNPSIGYNRKREKQNSSDKQKLFQKAVGEVLRTHRKAMNLSQEQLSENTELSRTFISETERGLYSISFYSVIELSNSLKIKPLTFFKEVFKEFEKNQDR